MYSAINARLSWIYKAVFKLEYQTEQIILPIKLDFIF